MLAIEVKGLKKQFINKQPVIKENGKKSLFKKTKVVKHAVNNISFNVEEGEALALIGPNGAGKSTTIKMLTGILQPTGGEIKVLGLNPTKNRVKLSYEIGSVFGQKEQLWVHLTPYDNFKFFASVYDVKKKDFEERLKSLANTFEITEFMHIPVKNLSLGQRMKCEMVASLLHNPKLLFFDEPTIGLDPVAKEALRNLIKKINKELKTTIIFTSHDVGDIEEVCNRVIIISNGEIVLDDSMKNLKNKHLNKKIVEVSFKKSENIKEQKGIKVIHSENNVYKIEVDLNITSVDKFMKFINVNNLQDITILSTPLEDIIKSIYKGNNEKIR